MAAKLDQAWYEKAADIIASSTSPEERLAALNEIWSEYGFIANRKVAGFTIAYELPVDWVRTMVDEQLKSATGYTLAEVIEFAKEKIANGTKRTTETHKAAANPE